MPIEIFTREQFEAVLPEKTVHLGIVEWEHCYLFPVTEKAGIFIRSSVHRDGIAAATNEDSIRIYPCAIRCIQAVTGPVWSYNLQGSPYVRWIDRRPRWQNRVQTMIEKVAATIYMLGDCTVCGKPLRILKVTKAGVNQGRWFGACEREHKQFVWIGD
jgi:hypothetical protein